MRTFHGAVTVAVVLVLSSPAGAHLGLRCPPSRYGEALLKDGPCGIPDSPLGGESRAAVILPDVECDGCTLQVIQGKPPYTAPGNDIYYQCADLVLHRSVVEPPGTGFELSCVGDCDASGVVTVDELLTGVEVVLGGIPLSRCLRLESASVDAMVAAVANALHGCSSTRLREFPNFQRFDFLRGPAFGFCPPYDSVLAATLRREVDGRYTLKTTVAERGVEGVDRCLIPGRFGGDCTLGRVQGCRTLTAEESAMARDALGSIVRSACGPRKPRIAG